MTIQRIIANAFGENTYIVSPAASHSDCAIIDPGLDCPEAFAALDRYLEANSLRPSLLLLTHAHVDHCYGLPHLHTHYGLTPHLHSADLPLYRSLADQALSFTGMAYSFDGLPDAATDLVDGIRLQLGTLTIAVSHTPGHSPGSVVLNVAADENEVSADGKPQTAAFTGDTLFQYSIGRTDLPLGSRTDMRRTLDRLPSIIAPATRLFPGHGGETTMADELRLNPYF